GTRAISLPEQGRSGDHRPVQGCRGGGGTPARRLVGMVDLAICPHHVSGRLSKPVERFAGMGVFILYLCPGRPTDPGAAAGARPCQKPDDRTHLVTYVVAPL